MQKKKERIKRMKQWDRLICNDDSSLGRICKYRRVAQRVTAILIQRAISISIDHRRQVLGGGTESDETKVEGGSGWYFLSMQNSAEGRSN